MNTPTDLHQRAEAERVLLAQAARERAAEASCRAGAADPFSPGCDTATNVLRYELHRIANLTPDQLLRGAKHTA